MTDTEVLDKLNGYLSQINKIAEEANKLAEEYQKSAEQASEDVTDEVLSEYLENTRDGKVYYINANGGVNASSSGLCPNDINSYVNYPSQEFAERAQKLKVFNDMLLAFKWCYDRDFEPDWNDDGTAKYTVVWDKYEGFHRVCSQSTTANQVYFSSDEAAVKCAAWLNKIDPKGELIS